MGICPIRRGYFIEHWMKDDLNKHLLKPKRNHEVGL